MNSKILKDLTILLIGIISLFGYAQKPIQLKVEYTSNPIGIDVVQPLFSWQIQTDQTKKGQLQSAYRIQVFNEQKELVWYSKKVISNN